MLIASVFIGIGWGLILAGVPVEFGSTDYWLLLFGGVTLAHGVAGAAHR